MRIGIFGGTFSPPHNTHIEMAENSVEQLHLDKLIILPCGIPPHKSVDVGKTHRYLMSRLAFGAIPHTEFDPYEMDKEGNSYTYLTLEHFAEKYPDDELFFIVGGDSIRDLSMWRNPARICELATIAVCERGGIDLDYAVKRAQALYRAKIVKVNINKSNVSSTDIRIDCQFGRKSPYLPDYIENYIKKHKLYCNFTPMVTQLKSALTEKKFEHTYYVVKRGIEYREQIPFDKAFAACLLHDCAKYVPQSDWEKYGYANVHNLPLDIVHAELGALVAQADYGITDKEILDAICYHTTARANMTQLDKLVFSADKTAANRPFPVAHLLAPTLNETFIRVLSELRDRYAGSRDLTKNQYEAYKQYLEE